MITSPQSMIGEIEALLHAGLTTSRADLFPLGRIDEITDWSGPLSAGVRVRILIALHAVNTSPAFSSACADAIAQADDWHDLLVTLLTATQINPSVVATAARVLDRRVPGHELSGLRADAVRVARICDAIDDGIVLRASRLAWSNLGEGPCWVVGLDDPVRQIVDAVAAFEDAGVVIDPGPSAWLERTRPACPAFLAIAV